MYYPILLRAGLIALTLGSIQAQADERYPAASFEPKVIYQAQEGILDSSRPAADTKAAALDADYPAAHFTPQVVFQDPELIDAVGPLPQPAARSAQAPAQPVVATPAKKSRIGQTGSISDSAPPYGAVGLAVAVIALAFWWSFRQEKLKEKTPEAPEPDQAPLTEASGEASKEVEEALEELAAEVEETLATTNRQRANKTKRTRRR